MTDLDRVARAFELFAVDCHDSSPIYERLALEIAKDEEMLALAAGASYKQPAPNLLFAAVRFLLDGGFDQFESLPVFRRFCQSHISAIQELLSTRRVQTNEVGRCSYLLPAFVEAAKAAKGRPLAMIEIGTSAGLLLNWDLYRYRYGSMTFGDAGAAVRLECEIRGCAPDLPNTMPAVASKLGIDIHVVDVRIDAEKRWLQSLVWPEHVDRARLLDAAIEVLREHPVPLISGDGLVMLPEVLAAVPSDVLPCVFHTAVLNQIPAEGRDRLRDLVTAYGQTRNLAWISAELGGKPSTVQVELTCWVDGDHYHTVVAHAHPHGRWLDCATMKP